MLTPRFCTMTFDMGSQSDVYHLKLPSKVRVDSKAVDIVLLVKSLSFVTIMGLKQIVEERRAMFTTFSPTMSLYCWKKYLIQGKLQNARKEKEEK